MGKSTHHFEIPLDGEYFSWGSRGVVKSHEMEISHEISPQYMAMLPPKCAILHILVGCLKKLESSLFNPRLATAVVDIVVDNTG